MTPRFLRASALSFATATLCACGGSSQTAAPAPKFLTSSSTASTGASGSPLTTLVIPNTLGAIAIGTVIASVSEGADPSTLYEYYLQMASGDSTSGLTLPYVDTSNWSGGLQGTSVVGVAGSVGTLMFDDASIQLKMRTLAATIPPDALKSIVELYIAFFNRVPDANGMIYWINAYKDGKTIAQIADSFYQVATSANFTQLTGYTTSMSDADFIKAIYKNVLGRDEVDAGGMTYWTTALANKTATRASLVNDILKAAHSYSGDPTYGWVASLLDNKVDVGVTFSINLGITFNDAVTAYLKGIDIAKAVTWDSKTDAYVQVQNMTGLTMTSIVTGVVGAAQTVSPTIETNTFADCVNPALYRKDAAYTVTMRRYPDYAASSETSTTTTTTSASATFNGTPGLVEQQLKFTPTGEGNSVTKSYLRVSAAALESFGSTYTTTTTGSAGTYTLTNYYTKPSLTPRSLAIGASVQNSYEERQLSSSSSVTPRAPRSITQTNKLEKIETITVPAGTFLACKMAGQDNVVGAYANWYVASGRYRGLLIKSDYGSYGIDAATALKVNWL